LRAKIGEIAALSNGSLRGGGRKAAQLSACGPQIVSRARWRIGGHEFVTGLLNSPRRPAMMLSTAAKYHIGQVLRHRKHPFRGVVFDVDAMFSNTEEWYQNIPEEARPKKDQPFYHLLAENDQSYYVAYVSEQNLVPDETGEPMSHPDLPDLFGDFEDGIYPLQFQLN
jgi:heat shock protein HspQ